MKLFNRRITLCTFQIHEMKDALKNRMCALKGVLDHSIQQFGTAIKYYILIKSSQIRLIFLVVIL